MSMKRIVLHVFAVAVLSFLSLATAQDGRQLAVTNRAAVKPNGLWFFFTATAPTVTT